MTNTLRHFVGAAADALPRHVYAAYSWLIILCLSMICLRFLLLLDAAML